MSNNTSPWFNSSINNAVLWEIEDLYNFAVEHELFTKNAVLERIHMSREKIKAIMSQRNNFCFWCGAPTDVKANCDTAICKEHYNMLAGVPLSLEDVQRMAEELVKRKMDEMERAGVEREDNESNQKE